MSCSSEKYIECLSAGVLHEYILNNFEKTAKPYPLVLALLCRCRLALQDYAYSGQHENVDVPWTN